MKAICILACLLILGCYESHNEEILFSKAQDAYSSNEYDTCLSILRRITNPKHDLKIGRLEALCEYKRGDFEIALPLLNDYLNQSPGDTQFIFIQGFVNYSLGRYSEALEATNKILVKDPNRLDVRILRGKTNAAIGNIENASLDYEIVLKNDSVNIIAINDIGLLYEKNGDPGTAIKFYNRAIELDEFNSTAYYNRGVSLLYLKNYEKAIDNFSKAISLNPSIDLYYYNLGYAFFESKNYSSACENWYKAKEMGNNNALDAYNEYCISE